MTRRRGRRDERPLAMALRRAVRAIYRAYPLGASVRMLLPWVALLLGEHSADLATTYVAISSGRAREYTLATTWAIARFGLVPALALNMAVVAALAALLLLASPLIRWMRHPHLLMALPCAVFAIPVVSNLLLLARIAAP